VPAFGLFVAAGALTGWGVRDSWRWVTLGLCALVWAAVLIRWFRRHRQMGVREHQRGMYQALCAWALTDVAVVLAWST
jgi:hypothetical protein